MNPNIKECIKYMKVDFIYITIYILILNTIY